jgi:putative transposase
MPDKYQNKYRISSARALWWDYGKNGAYFITICTAHRDKYFGEIGQTTEIGKMAHQFWMEIPSHFPFVGLDEFVIMPNHVHGIIMINHNTGMNHVETLHATSLPSPSPSPSPESDPISENKSLAHISPKTGSLSTVIRSFKSAVTKWCNENQYKFGWQTRFHDHIIRTDAELDRIREYIIDNPKNWINDKFNNL